MKNTKKIFFIIVLVILFVAIFFFNTKNNKQKYTLESPDQIEDSIVLESLRFQNEKIILYEGSELQLEVEKKPAEVDEEIIWESSNDKIAIVDKFGKIITKKAGITKITAKNEKGSVSTEVVIKVKAITKEQTLELSEKAIDLNVGENALIEYAILPTDATYKYVKWESEDKNIAKVEDGLITANNEGKTIITAQTKHGVKASIEVNVNVVEMKNLAINADKLTIKKGEKINLIPVITPINATTSGFLWRSENSEIASVDKHGKVTGKELGKTTITLFSVDGKFESSSEIIVTDSKINPTEIKINNDNIELKEEDSVELSVSFKPDNTTNKVVTWSSSDTDIAIVSQTGIVTGIKKGTATITAKTIDGNIETSQKVTVFEKYIEPKNISISQKDFSLSVGETIYIDATITPTLASNKTIEWSSTNKTVAEVENGKITALKPGITEIIAKTYNGIQDKITVEVNNHFEITYLNGLLAEEITENDVKNMKSLGITLIPLESNSTDITEYRYYMLEALSLLSKYDIDVIATDYQMKQIIERHSENTNCNPENKTFCYDFKDEQIKELLTEMVDFYNSKELKYNEEIKSYAYENLVGWNIKNEPNTKEFDRISLIVKFLNNYDFSYNTYINLQASYKSNEELYGSIISIKSYYEDYVNKFIKKVKTKVLSTNYNFNISEDELTSKKEYYSNLSIIKSISKANNVIPMNITNISKTSTINEIAWQSSINLAFKMKRISYNNYKNVVIDNNKNTTLTYYNIMKINTWLYALGNELYDKELVNTYSFNDDSLAPYNTSNLYGKITGTNNGLISVFDNNSFLLVNSEFKVNNVFTFESSLLDMKWFNPNSRRWEDINGNLSTDYYTINTTNNTIEILAGYCVLLSK